MASSAPNPDAPRIFQDLPPKGGFPEVRSAAYLPQRGYSGPLILAVMGVVTVWGTHRVVKQQHLRGEWRREIRQAQRDILPLLQAESDRLYIREHKARLLLEAEVMHEFKDWKVGENVYKTTDWMPPLNPPAYSIFVDPGRPLM